MKLTDILKESIEEATVPSTNKYINRGRLNKNAVADYLRSVIDPEYLKDVNTFMRDPEGWGESSSYFFDGDDDPFSKLLQAVSNYKRLGQNNNNPLYKPLQEERVLLLSKPWTIENKFVD